MKYCLALDLNDDAEVIAEYEKWHQHVWPEVKTSILDSGITQMEIYRTGNRLFMIMETLEDFSFERKAEQDRNNPLVMEWEKLMWSYQKALPWAKPAEKWVRMECIFKL
ncbi:MAG TPA: L-rhamnose mutarotase [Ohtaekwangia sp.]|nr:L-rhamnose mutarotase [Ohtaekwangia sp.]